MRVYTQARECGRRRRRRVVCVCVAVEVGSSECQYSTHVRMASSKNPIMLSGLSTSQRPGDGAQAKIVDETQPINNNKNVSND